MNISVKMLENEYWWGASSSTGEQQPFGAESSFAYDMNCGTNQTMPFFLSSKGRYIWCDSPMVVRIENGEIHLSARDEILVCEAGESLRDA